MSCVTNCLKTNPFQLFLPFCCSYGADDYTWRGGFPGHGAVGRLDEKQNGPLLPQVYTHKVWWWFLMGADDGIYDVRNVWMMQYVAANHRINAAT